jgi:hypothetical protein
MVRPLGFGSGVVRVGVGGLVVGVLVLVSGLLKVGLALSEGESVLVGWIKV